MTDRHDAPGPARRLSQITWSLLALWTAVMAMSLAWNLSEQQAKVVKLARNAAEINFENDVIYRQWVAGHGGVYVPVSDEVPPNPYLEVPHRDVTASSGVALTLVNPAYMTRMVNAMSRKATGARSHITSLNPIRPENRADPWEEAALRAFEAGEREVGSVEEMDDGEYVRFMRPFVTEKACLACHAAQGYQEGDIRGGISVSIPMAPLRAIQAPVTLRMSLFHVGLWAAGVVGIALSRNSLAGQIAAREQVRDALQRSEERYRTLFDSMSEGSALHEIIVDASGRPCDYRFLDVNPAFERLTGLKRHLLLGKRVLEVLPGTEAYWIEAFGRVAQTGNPAHLENYSAALNRWYEVFAYRPAPGQFAVVFSDVTDRKQAEERTRASLHEKEILLKEIHHRVKNNMQVISSLVSLQADALPDESARAVLRNVTDRVRSMALVHEKLYQSADLARVNFAEYAQSLLQYLWRAHGSHAPGIRLALDLEPVWLDVEAAVPCGLVLNELAGNALKHAFPGRAEGEVAVSLRRAADGRVSLEVRDNGKGLPPGLDWRQTRSLGLHLVDMLSGQLDAAVEVPDGEGTTFRLAFSDADATDHA